MRHLRAHRRLGRNSAHRKQLLRNLVSSLFLAKSGRIRTTVEKAKEARPIAEKMITLGKRESVHARRLAARYLPQRAVVQRLFNDIAPTFADRKGGYTRLLRLGPRAGDNADMALLELVGIAEQARKEQSEAKQEQKSQKGKDGAEKAKAAEADAPADPKAQEKAKRREAKKVARAEKPAAKEKVKPSAKSKAKASVSQPKGRKGA